MKIIMTEVNLAHAINDYLRNSGINVRIESIKLQRQSRKAEYAGSVVVTCADINPKVGKNTRQSFSVFDRRTCPDGNQCISRRTRLETSSATPANNPAPD